MSEITNIETQKKHKNRVNVFLDYEYALSMNYDLMLQHGLKVGKVVQEDELKQLVLENEKSIALQKASMLLGKSLKTEKQMKTYLKDKGYDPHVVNYVVKKLCEYNYLNDENYVNIYLRSVKNKFGKYKIENELSKKGIKKELIEQAMKNFESNEQAIESLANKFLKNKEINRETVAKLNRHLIGKGFGYDEIKNVTQQFLKGEWCWLLELIQLTL